MKTLNIYHLSYYLVEYFNGKGMTLTHLKLQKLLYYQKSWGLVSGKFNLDGYFKAWKNGPVNEEVYEKYKKFGSNHISLEKEAFPISDYEVNQIVDFVTESYAPYQAYTLSAMTHSEKPWKETVPNSIIDDKLILSYYSTQPFSKNFPLDKHKPYYPVYTDFFASFIMDMDENDPASDVHFSSFEEYKNHLADAQPYLDKLIQKFAG